jgi:membrane protein implicated in regulation of membrane protease activity
MKYLMYIVTLIIGGFGLWILSFSIPGLFSAAGGHDAIGKTASVVFLPFSTVGIALVLFAAFVFYMNFKEEYPNGNTSKNLKDIVKDDTLQN